MSQPRTYIQQIAEPPDWMDEEERVIRQNIINDMIELTKRHGCIPLVVGELLARYIKGELDDQQLMNEFDRAYRSRCH